MTVQLRWAPVQAGDGHRWETLLAHGARVDRALTWIPALGVSARTYESFARALAFRGVAVAVHEWRGLGSSNVRAGKTLDWSYRQLLELDIPATRVVAEREWGTAANLLGGHSLGGQLATCALALDPRSAQALWLVASGAPYWRAFPAPLRFGLPAAYHVLDALARVAGALPGRRIGFGGREARGVIREWARTGLTGRYDIASVGDLEPRLARLDAAVRAAVLADDWLAPRSSLDFLLAKTGASDVRIACLDSGQLGVRADHFEWMKSPDAVAHALVC